jgi:UDP-N-acetylglucosamine diphosphorylase/glucosamine-1-phosphate N-acetyltransferase
MKICLFEDLYFDHFEPLVFTRPTYNLFCGMLRMRDKVRRAYPEPEIVFHTRGYLEAFLGEKNPKYKVNTIDDNDCLFINGRIFAHDDLPKIIDLKNKTNKLYMNGETIIAARVSGKKLDELKSGMHDLFTVSNFDGLPVEQVDVKYATFIWDLVHGNKREIIKDFELFIKQYNLTQKDFIQGKVYEGVHMIEPASIIIREGAVVYPGTVLDATEGPIFIDRNAIVYPNAVIQGPVYIGEQTKVKAGANLYDGVSTGKVCKVGGEIEASIIMPYSNKQHSGFLGHAYLGSWINIGADTNSSDLKNNYGTVKITLNGDLIDSGHQFLGLIMGDHSKAAINSQFNTGTVVGFSCNIFSSGFPKKYLPSFSWGGGDLTTTFDIEKSIETARRMVSRRSKTISEVEEKLFRKIFDLTQKTRRKLGYPY